jgi:hypothetical protein
MESIKGKPGEQTSASLAPIIPNINDYEDKYLIKMDDDHKIGFGQFAKVYRITRKSDGKVLAMKASQSVSE